MHGVIPVCSCSQDARLRLRDLPEVSSPEFPKLLQELGFPLALERVKIAKAVAALTALRDRNEAKDGDGDATDANDANDAKFDTWQYHEMSKGQKAEAKSMVKDFVKAMVHGRSLQRLSMDSGELQDVQVSLNKKVDRLTIEAGAGYPVVADLCDILDVVPLEPDLTVMVKTCESETCLLFSTVEERDAFTNALGILSQVAQRGKPQNDGSSR